MPAVVRTVLRSEKDIQIVWVFLKNLFLLWASLSFMGIFCLFGYLMKKIKKEDRIPFYPFVLCAFLVMLLISGGDLYA